MNDWVAWGATVALYLPVSCRRCRLACLDGFPELGRQQVAGSSCIAFVIIQGITISSRMLCGTQGASHETVSVQRRRFAQPQDREDAAFESEEIGEDRSSKS